MVYIIPATSFRTSSFKDGELSNENNFKDKADYGAYKESTPEALAKFKFRSAMIEDFKDALISEIGQLIV